MQDNNKILIVEDNHSVASLISDFLNNKGYDNSIQYSGKNAIHKIGQEKFNLVILDIHLPDINGKEVLANIRMKKESSELPVIVVSATNKNEHITKMLELGANDFISKPFDKITFMIKVRNLLQLQNSNQLLKKQNIEVKELNNIKNKLFSIIGHDLKNPLNTLIGFAQLLDKHYNEYSDEKKQRFNSLILASAKSAYGLLENLLLWAKREVNQSTIIPRKIQISSVINKNIEYFHPSTENKGIVIHHNISSDIYVYADINMITTIIRNLLSNAIKFSPTDSIINISGKESNSHFIISIADRGRGMRKEKLDTLFKLDKTESTPGTSGEKGTGLGLIICKDFIKQNNGDIWVESSPDEGTTFYIKIPTVLTKTEKRENFEDFLST